MYTSNEIMETIKMIQEENLDVRTITMGISLIDCMDTDINKIREEIDEDKTNRTKSNNL